ncbi:MAG: hypothetical protein JWM68_516 [Verrucomicrobiales bacterium]|nr:hypothetical protein [Verrucomicrobiales bacterium]
MKTKRIIWFVLPICVIALILGVSSYDNNLVSNGYFEKGLANWNPVSTSLLIDPKSSTSGLLPYHWNLIRTRGLRGWFESTHNNNFAMIGAGNKTGGLISQKIPLHGKGGRYQLSFDFAATGDSGRIGALEVSVVDANGQSLLSKNLTNSTPVQTWYVPDKLIFLQKFEFETPPEISEVTLSFLDHSPGGGIAIDTMVKAVRLKRMH